MSGPLRRWAIKGHFFFNSSTIAINNRSLVALAWAGMILISPLFLSIGNTQAENDPHWVHYDRCFRFSLNLDQLRLWLLHSSRLWINVDLKWPTSDTLLQAFSILFISIIGWESLYVHPTIYLHERSYKWKQMLRLQIKINHSVKIRIIWSLWSIISDFLFISLLQYPI